MQYPPEIIDRICDQLLEGKSLRQICSQEGMPDRVTVWRWGKGDDDIGDRLRDAWEVGFLSEGERIYEEVLACDDPKKAEVMLRAAQWHLGRRSAAYADKPLFQGALVNVGGHDAFAAFAGALEEARSARAGGATSTITVGANGAPGPIDAPGELARLAGAGGERLGQDPDGG